MYSGRNKKTIPKAGGCKGPELEGFTQADFRYVTESFTLKRESELRKWKLVRRFDCKKESSSFSVVDKPRSFMWLVESVVKIIILFEKGKKRS